MIWDGTLASISSAWIALSSFSIASMSSIICSICSRDSRTIVAMPASSARLAPSMPRRSATLRS